MRKLAVILVLAIASHAQGAMTLLFREMFATTGTLTSGAPGSNFTNVTGTLYQRAGGPRLSAGTSASADVQSGANYGKFVLSNPAKMLCGAWVFVKTMNTTGAGEYKVLWVEDQFGNPGQQIAVKNGVLGGGLNGGTQAACPIDATNQWVWLGIGIVRTSGTTGDWKYYYKTVGGSLTAWGAVSGGNMGIGTTGRVGAGAANANAALNYRVGAPSVYSFAQSDFSDVTYPSDVIEPASQLTWYVNPATGNDSNDGTSSGNAWKTVAKLNTESQYCGIFSAASYATGDTLVIDTSGGDFDLGGTPITFQTAGLNVRAATGQTWAVIKPWKTIAAGDWSTTAYTNVYSTTDTIALACLWEDDKWLTHVNGANIGAVNASLTSTAGSFWTDGTTLYYHAIGDTDPRSDGKVRTRTAITSAAVNANAANMNIQNLYIRKTCDVNATTGIPNGGYSIGTGGTWAGTNLIKNCYLDYYGKHALGLVANSASNEVTTIDAVQAEQGSPYGSQSPFVSYNSNATTPTGITHTYQNCVTLKTEGLIGSTAGQNLGTNSTLLSHNNGTGTQFGTITVTDCNFSKGQLALSVNTASVITKTTVGTITVNDPNCVITRCLVDWRGIVQSYTSSPVLAVRNCIFAPTDAAGSIFSGTQGTSTWEGNTFDTTGITGADSQAGIFKRAGASTMTVRDNVFIVPASKSYTIFQAYVNTDTLTITNNAYRLGKNTEVAFQYNDGSTTAARTFAQWQTLGFDANSVNSSNLLLAANYRPIRGSPVINAGVDLGPLVDYSGRLFQVRNDIGAYELTGTAKIPSMAGMRRDGVRP